MRNMLLIAGITVTLSAMPVIASAHGCLKGAAVGGVAGHVAGHHAVAGAAIGCAVGHHRAKVKERQAAQTAAGQAAAGQTAAHAPQPPTAPAP
jgi:hypothetical protein